jgi:hypothetical protein
MLSFLQLIICTYVCDFQNYKCVWSGSGYFATNSQSASLSWSQAPIWGSDQIFITFGHLRSSCWGASSLRRWRVCNLLVQFAVILWPKSRRTHYHILLSHVRPYFTVSYETPPTFRARSLYLYSPGTGGLVISPDTGFPFCRLLRLAGLQWRWYVWGCYFNF